MPTNRPTSSAIHSVCAIFMFSQQNIISLDDLCTAHASRRSVWKMLLFVLRALISVCSIYLLFMLRLLHKHIYIHLYAMRICICIYLLQNEILNDVYVQICIYIVVPSANKSRNHKQPTPFDAPFFCLLLMVSRAYVCFVAYTIRVSTHITRKQIYLYMCVVCVCVWYRIVLTF